MAEPIQLAPNVWKKNNSTYLLKCNETGEVKMCSADRFEKLIKKYGNVNILSEQYKSRSPKEKQTVEPVSAPIAIEKQQTPQDVPTETTSNIERTFWGDQFSKCPNSSADHKVYNTMAEKCECVRPNLFRKNNGFCNGCNWFNMCTFEYKKIGDGRSNMNREDALKKVIGTVDIYTEYESKYSHK